VGRAGFEPATNWLKASNPSYPMSLFLIGFHYSSSPHFRQFHHSFGPVFPSIYAFSIKIVGKGIVVFRLAQRPRDSNPEPCYFAPRHAS